MLLVLIIQIAGGLVAAQSPEKVRGVPRTHLVRKDGSTQRRLGGDKEVYTPSPTPGPTMSPTPEPSPAPSPSPTEGRGNDKDEEDEEDDRLEMTSAPMESPEDIPATSPPVAQPVSYQSSTVRPTRAPTKLPSSTPTQEPTLDPTKRPSQSPTLVPTIAPSPEPSASPSAQPSPAPSAAPTTEPSASPTSQPSAKPSMSPKLDLTDFYILLVKNGGEINVGAVTATLEKYLYEGMVKKYSGLDYVQLDLLEGESGYDSQTQMSSALRYAGVASFKGAGSEPDQTSFNAEQGFLLTSSQADIQEQVDENESLDDVGVVKVSFESLDACQPFPKDCRGERIEDGHSTMVLVVVLGAVSLLVMSVATLILRRHVKARAITVHSDEKENVLGKADDTSASHRSGGEAEASAVCDIRPGCASLVGSQAQVELDDKTRNVEPTAPRSPLTPYSAERPQEIQIRQFGESEDELDLDYLTMDEDLKSTYFDPSKHAYDTMTLDGDKSCETDEQTLSPEGG